MKLFATVIIFLFTLKGGAQDPKIPTPDYDNVPYYYDEPTNALIPLEKANYHVESKAKGLFGAGIYFVVPGATSKLRYSITQKIQFVIHFDDARTEPSILYALVPLTVNTKNNNNQREYMAKSSGLGHSETNQTQILTNAKRIGEGLYLITFSGPITSGEYAITIEKTKQAYAFGIDGYESSTRGSSESNEKPHPHDPLGEAIYRKIQKDKEKSKQQ